MKKVMTPIKVVRAWRVKIPLKEPYYLSKIYPTITHSDCFVIELEADDLSGWGEADPGGKAFTLETCEDVEVFFRSQMAERLLDSSIEELSSGRYPQGVTGSVRSALNVAANDWIGRRASQPICEILGARCWNELPSLWPTSSGTAEQDLAVISRKYIDGYRTFMLKMGSRPIEDDIERVHHVMHMIPADVRLMVDANQGWTLLEAKRFIDATNSLSIALIEQPLPRELNHELVSLRRLSKNPISVDESLLTPSDARQLIEQDAADIFSVKISKNGGINDAIEICKIAEAAGVKVMFNSMIELGITQAAALQVGAITPNVVDFGHAFMSVQRTQDDVTDFGLLKKLGTVALSSRPGLGVDVLKSKIEDYSQSFVEISK